MGQNGEISAALGRVVAAVAGLPSGKALINALEALPEAKPATFDLLAAVVNEAKGSNGSVAATSSAPAARLTLDTAAAVVSQLMFLTPRGKQDFAFFSDHLVIKTNKQDIVIPFKAVKNIVILDAIPKDTKGRVLLYLHLAKEEKIMNGKAHLTAAVIQVHADQQLDVAHPAVKGQRLQGLAAVVLCQAFGAVGLDAELFCSPDGDVFTSSDGAAGVEAYVKARQGFLFPLPAGLCFLESPAMFIPRANIRSVELARASGASSTFDLYVHCADDSTLEFSNISRNEIGSIEGYLRKIKVAVGPVGSSASEGSEGGAGGSEGSDSDDPEDEDFNPAEASDEDEAPKKKKRKRGEASGAAAEEKKTVAGQSGVDVELPEAGDEYEDGESASEDSSSSSEDSEDDDSVELVSEDEFSMGQLKGVVEKQAKE